MLQLLIHVFADALHGHMAGTLDHYLYIVFPGSLCQFTKCTQFRELGFVVGIVD